MKKSNFGISIILTSLVVLTLACKPKEITPIPSGPKIENANIPTISESTTEIDASIVIVSGSYTTVGALLPTPVRITQEMTYKDGKLIREKSSSFSNGSGMAFTQEYDNEGRVLSFFTEQNGDRSVTQINKYTEDGLILSEFRLEKGSTKNDTIIYEYHYPKKRTNPMHYHRTNNGKKVTEMTLTKEGNKEILVERAFGSKDYIGIITTTTIKNNEGNILEEQQTSISSSWQDRSKLDTTINEPTFYKYDKEGRLLRKASENQIMINGSIQHFYTKEGILRKKIIMKNGQPPQVVKFTRI